MEKKYELTDDTIEINGHTLHRIRALKSFPGVGKGDLGGYIESENNLSHHGDCWVYHNAKVYEKATVLEDAIILEYAQVFGNACIAGHDIEIVGHATIYEHAKVIDHSFICEYAQVFGYAHIENSSIRGYAKVYGSASIVNSEIKGCSEIFGNRTFVRNATILGDTIIKSNKDYIVFKNNFSSGREFTWTRSNNKWSVGCFFGTEEELIEKAFEDNEKKGRSYKAYVDLVKKLCEIEQDIDESYEIVPHSKVYKYMRFEGFGDNCSIADDFDSEEKYGLGAFYINKKWKEEVDKIYHEEV